MSHGGAQLLPPGSPKGAGEERIYSQLLPPPAFWSLAPPNDAPRSQLGQWMTIEQLRAFLVLLVQTPLSNPFHCLGEYLGYFWPDTMFTLKILWDFHPLFLL